MPLFIAEIEIEDDPAYFSATVLVVADDETKALRAAKKAAKNAYFGQAGGWGSSNTKITNARVEPYDLPKKGVVLVAAAYDG